MPVLPTDLVYDQSSNPISTGGPISAITIDRTKLVNLLPPVTALQQQNGNVSYIKIFLANNNLATNWLNPTFWMLAQPTSGESIAIGFGTANDTNPGAVTFSAPSSFATGLTTASIPFGNAISLWIRRTTPVAQPNYDISSFQLACQGTDGVTTLDLILTFSWSLIPPPEGALMSSSLQYTFTAQVVDQNNVAGTPVVINNTIALPSDISGDDRISIPAGAVDQPLQIANGGNIDFAFLSTDIPISVKFNSLTAVPDPLQANGCIIKDTQNISSIYVTNTQIGAAKVRLIQASRS